MKAFSSPGKALIAGGYLVLDPEYNAYVTALSARMHAVVSSVPAGSTTGNDTGTDGAGGAGGTGGAISVVSPQFSGRWTYTSANDWNEINGNNNPFLAAVVSTVMTYIQPSGSFNLEITIYSDPGFHTQNDTTEKSSKNGAKSFFYHEKPITEVPKTGLGSSACLTSVVTAALLSYFKSDVLKDILHNLCQIAHCKAQKKIGSGFDVATAVFGSIQYRRFRPSVIEAPVTGTVSHQEMVELVDSSWDFTHDACALPPHIKLLMGDISGGSETPKLVSTVLQWKNQNPQLGQQLYANLDAANVGFISALNDLHKFYKLDKERYMKAIDYFKTHSINTSVYNTEFDPFFKLIKSLETIRKYLKQLTVESGAEIEPECQTELLDACKNLNGTLGGVVPGAGGYDAICVLVIDDSIDGIVNLHDHKQLEHVTWLDLQEEAEGLVEEDPEDYRF